MISDAFQAMVEVHQSMGSPLPDFLRPPVESDDEALPDELNELYALTDGVDLEAWNNQYPGRPAYFLPRWDFPSRQKADELTTLLRGAGSDEFEPDDPSSPQWLGDTRVVFSKLTVGDEDIAYKLNDGQLWVVSWPDDIRPLGFGLEELLQQAVTLWTNLGAAWDPDLMMVTWDRAVGRRLLPFP